MDVKLYTYLHLAKAYSLKDPFGSGLSESGLQRRRLIAKSGEKSERDIAGSDGALTARLTDTGPWAASDLILQKLPGSLKRGFGGGK